MRRLAIEVKMVLLGVEMAVGRGEFDGGWGGRDGLAAPGMEDSIWSGLRMLGVKWWGCLPLGQGR